MNGEELLKALVIDSGAIIRGHGTNFHRRSERFVTVQEVLEEIRDSKSRDLLASLPYELEVRSPSDDAMQAVAAFARKSGDFAALSLTDLKLIALTYTIEKEITGGANIRTEPTRSAAVCSAAATKKKSTKAVNDIPEGELLDSVIRSMDASCNCAEEAAARHIHAHPLTSETEVDREEYAENEEEEADEEEEVNEEEEEEGGGGDDEEGGEQDAKEEEEDDRQPNEITPSTSTAVRHVFATLIIEEEFPSLGTTEAVQPRAALASSSWAHVAKTGDNEALNAKQPKKAQPYTSILPAKPDAAAKLLVKAPTKSSPQPVGSIMPSRILAGNSNGHSTMASMKAAMEDDGEGWINTSNFKSRALEDSFRNQGDKKKASAVDEEKVVVACITTDFSMQNVLMQMGLHIISVDGMVVKTVKQWVLRCMACYKVHYEMDRLFCENCGANHLSRVSCSIDMVSGLLKLHLKKGYQPNTRGKLYSLPKPGKQGRYEGELLLREDQLLQGIWQQKKMAIQRNLKSAFGEDVTGDVGVHVNKGKKIRVGLGSQNPNAAKGRERRGKAK